MDDAHARGARPRERRTSEKTAGYSRLSDADHRREAPTAGRPIGTAESRRSGSTFDNNSYRASIGAVGVPADGPQMRPTPCCCARCRASSCDLRVRRRSSWCRCPPCRCLCVVQRLVTIASGAGASIDTSPPFRRPCPGRSTNTVQGHGCPHVLPLPLFGSGAACVIDAIAAFCPNPMRLARSRCLLRASVAHPRIRAAKPCPGLVARGAVAWRINASLHLQRHR